MSRTNATSATISTTNTSISKVPTFNRDSSRTVGGPTGPCIKSSSGFDDCDNFIKVDDAIIPTKESKEEKSSLGSNPPSTSGSRVGLFDCKVTSQVFGLLAKIPMPKPLPIKEFKASQLIYWPAKYSNAGGAVYHGFYFVLGDLPDYTALNDVFDTVRVDKAHFIMTPSEANTIGAVGKYHVAVDFDDANAPASVAAVLNHQTAITVPGHCGVRFDWVPASVVLTAGTLSTQYTVMQRAWLNLDYPTTMLFGLKIAWEGSATTLSYDVSLMLDLTFKSLR